MEIPRPGPPTGATTKPTPQKGAEKAEAFVSTERERRFSPLERDLPTAFILGSLAIAASIVALAVSVSGVGDDFKSIGIDTFESVKEAGAAAAAAAPAALRTVRGILMEPREGASQHADASGLLGDAARGAARGARCGGYGVAAGGVAALSAALITIAQKFKR